MSLFPTTCTAYTKQIDVTHISGDYAEPLTPSLAHAQRRRGFQSRPAEKLPRLVATLKSALVSHSMVQDVAGIGRCLNRLSKAHFEMQQYDRALAYSQAAVAVLEDTDAKYDYAIALYQLGINHLELRHLASAEHSFENALQHFCQLSDLEYENRSLVYLGKIYAQQHQFLFALACYESVLDSLIANPFLENRLDLLRALLQAVAQLGQQPHAVEAEIAGFQSVVAEYSLAAYHLQVAAHLQPHQRLHQTAPPFINCRNPVIK